MRWSYLVSTILRFLSSTNCADHCGRLPHRCLGVLSRMSISVEERVRITRGSVIAFLEAFVPKLEAAGTRDKPWRLVWLGGMIMVRDQQASIWLLPGMRKSAVRAPFSLLSAGLG